MPAAATTWIPANDLADSDTIVEDLVEWRVVDCFALGTGISVLVENDDEGEEEFFFNFDEPVEVITDPAERISWR